VAGISEGREAAPILLWLLGYEADLDDSVNALPSANMSSQAIEFSKSA
jgi:hypothetical protein